jgi:hypothetical protein
MSSTFLKKLEQKQGAAAAEPAKGKSFESQPFSLLDDFSK